MYLKNPITGELYKVRDIYSGVESAGSMVMFQQDCEICSKEYKIGDIIFVKNSDLLPEST